MKCVVYWYFMVFLVYEVTAFYNIALGRNVTVYFYNPFRTFSTTNLTDGSNTTCESLEGRQISFRIDLGKAYSIKSSVLTFKGYYSGNTTLQYHDDSNDWPHYVYKTFVTEIPQRVEFDVQRTGKLIVYDFRKHMTDALEFEFCEIGIYGCETDHFGSDCQQCIKNDNCEVCDVNNGECYVCKEGYTGPNCSMSTDNVALHKSTELYSNDEYRVFLPSYLLVDGDTTQPSCIDFKSYLNGTIFTFNVYLGDVYNVNGVRLYFTYEGAADNYVNYTVGYSTSHPHSGIERISANSTEVIIPFPHKIYQNLYIAFTLLVDEIAEMNDVPVLLCEIEVNGCPPNHYDGSCVCQAGYKGWNCTEACSNNTYGVNCVYSCGHCINETCDHVTGNCSIGCDRGWTTSKCNTACSSGWYGQDCVMRCSSHCITPDVCDHVTGSCVGGCATGWTNDACDSAFNSGWYR
ncbi:uncharacterized protein LOC125662467 [Ostrea edulis]|uniref:uncharacterized protein LOC125662467 n=1 Tax=Ostrea edulis TaxID=37623 RepID=UPI0024AF0BB7|nr:uncharacterized protein LOC125662467 [Ostrea edulis]